MINGQLQFDVGPEAQQAMSAPPLFTPPRVALNIEVLERGDDPEAVVVTVRATDGEGQLLALVSGLAPGGCEWGDALALGSRWARWAYYESHSPF